MYLICFFGVIGRGIQYTRASHVAHILDVLQKKGIAYKVLVVNNNIGNEMIDGEHIDNDDRKFIPSDVRIELNQQLIDEEIMKTYPKYWEIFQNTCSYSNKKCCLNALRQSYIEHCVSSHISDDFEKVIAISADFQLIHDIPIQDIASMKDELIVSDMNHAHGYTNGLYIGCGKSVKKAMNHFYNLQNGMRDYEQIIKINTEKQGIRVISKHIIFAKIRANRDVFIKNKRLKKKIMEALDRDYPR